MDFLLRVGTPGGGRLPSRMVLRMVLIPETYGNTQRVPASGQVETSGDDTDAVPRGDQVTAMKNPMPIQPQVRVGTRSDNRTDSHEPGR